MRRFIERHLDGSRGESDLRELVPQPHRVERIADLVAQRIASHGACRYGVESELGDMESEVCGRAADFSAFGQEIPERLADADDEF